MNFKFGTAEFSPENPFVIAEVGVNHEGVLARADSMIAIAATAGANAVKFQTYKADKLASKSHSKAYWNQSFEPMPSQHALFSKYDGFATEDFRHLNSTCKAHGVEFMSTPFDLEAVDELGFQRIIKIASADLTNVPLRRKIASKGLPTILSTGASTLAEIDVALDDLEKHGAGPIVVMHCVLNYPTRPTEGNLARIRVLAERFRGRVSIGYSDHVRAHGSPPLQLLLAAEYGATVLEKHFTDDKTLPGNDHYHAMDGSDLEWFSKMMALRRELISGDGGDQIELQSAARENARRRLFLKWNLEAGVTISEEHLIALRSNIGIGVEEWDQVVGARLNRSLKAGEPLLREHLAK